MRLAAFGGWTYYYTAMLQPRNPTQFSTLTWILLTTAFYTLVIFQLSRTTACQRDPTSLFFRPAKGYEPIYSTIRRNQAEGYIRKLTDSAAAAAASGAQELGHATSSTAAGPPPPPRFDASQRESGLCVAIPTVARKNARYFRSAVGSLLEGLTDHERRQLYIVLFVANSDPAMHPAYSEGWMQKLADEVLVYSNATAEVQEHVKELERVDVEFREKPLFDYSYLMKACLRAGTSHMALLEDDVIAMDGWYHRTKKAIREAESRTALEHGLTDFLYLRLFYTEQFLGWNSEHWPKYLSLSLLAFLSLSAALLTTRSFSLRARKHLTNQAILCITLVHLPIWILLFFFAGRMVVNPLREGVVEMNNFGCCSQGFVFSRTMAPRILDWYAEKRIGFADMLMEELGDLTGLPRWAIVPSVLQHVGSMTSKSDSDSEEELKRLADPNRVRTVAETIWNFGFETFDARRLRVEHHREAGRLEVIA